MREAVDRLGGDGGALAVLAPLPLARQPDRALDLPTTMARVPALVDAGVTDLLVHARVPDSFAGALDVYSDLVAAFKAVTNMDAR
jgi:hypothetical protein